jgi:AcrR family transcriptional regulator
MVPEGTAALPRRQCQRSSEVVSGASGETVAGVDEIVACARVSRTSFYEHYDNKEDCLLAAFARGMARMAEAVSAAVRQPLAPLERIRAEVAAVARTFAEDPAMARVMLVVIVGATPAAEHAHRNMRATAAAIIEAQLDEYPYWQRRTGFERRDGGDRRAGERPRGDRADRRVGDDRRPGDRPRRPRAVAAARWRRASRRALNGRRRAGGGRAAARAPAAAAWWMSALFA